VRWWGTRLWFCIGERLRADKLLKMAGPPLSLLQNFKKKVLIFNYISNVIRLVLNKIIRKYFPIRISIITALI
jgi:hypothetical protein